MKVIAAGDAVVESLAARPRPSDPPAAASKPASATPADHAPTIELVRQGDRITRIQVRCSCGELIELECDYSP